MKRLFALMILFRFNRRRRIVIEPDPYHIRAVFEGRGERFFAPTAPFTHWRWPSSTWMQRRLDLVRRDRAPGGQLR